MKLGHMMQSFTHTRVGGVDKQSDMEPLCRTVSKHQSKGCRVRSESRGVPSGSLAVYVGAEKTRFVISTLYLNHRLFKDLLKRSEEEFGFHYRGGLNVACEPNFFEHLLWMIATNDPTASTADLDDLMEFYSL